MTVIAVGSVTGAPGTTTLVVELAASWPRPVLVVEADGDGGCLAARCDLAVRPGLTELAGASRAGLSRAEDVWRFAQETSFGVAIVVAHPRAELVHSALRAAAPQIAVSLGEIDADVLIDVGRVRPGSPSLPLVHAADRRLLVTGSTLEDAVAMVHRSELLAGLGDIELMVQGPGEHSAPELESATGYRVLGVRPTRRTSRLRTRSLRRDGRWLAGIAAELAGPDNDHGMVSDDPSPDDRGTAVDLPLELADDADPADDAPVAAPAQDDEVRAGARR